VTGSKIFRSISPSPTGPSATRQRQQPTKGHVGGHLAGGRGAEEPTAESAGGALRDGGGIGWGWGWDSRTATMNIQFFFLLSDIEVKIM